jgi:hypothetical protein
MIDGKKTAMILMVGLFMVLVFRLNMISAQGYKKGSDFVERDELALVEEKIDKIINILSEKGAQEKSDKEILNKLNQVLSNQEKILAELDVVKIRATRK